jgi:hypothetical protein
MTRWARLAGPGRPLARRGPPGGLASDSDNDPDLPKQRIHGGAREPRSPVRAIDFGSSPSRITARTKAGPHQLPGARPGRPAPAPPLHPPPHLISFPPSNYTHPRNGAWPCVLRAAQGVLPSGRGSGGGGGGGEGGAHQPGCSRSSRRKRSAPAPARRQGFRPGGGLRFDSRIEGPGGLGGGCWRVLRSACASRGAGEASFHVQRRRRRRGWG